MFLPAALPSHKIVKGNDVILASLHLTVSSELVWIDLNFLNGISFGFQFSNSLLCKIEPFLIGIGNVRVWKDEPPESV